MDERKEKLKSYEYYWEKGFWNTFGDNLEKELGSSRFELYLEGWDEESLPYASSFSSSLLDTCVKMIPPVRAADTFLRKYLKRPTTLKCEIGVGEGGKQDNLRLRINPIIEPRIGSPISETLKLRVRAEIGKWGFENKTGKLSTGLTIRTPFYFNVGLSRNWREDSSSMQVYLAQEI